MTIYNNSEICNKTWRCCRCCQSLCTFCQLAASPEADFT